jgi:hypothetical protein
LGEELDKFSHKVRIVVIADCCESGTSIRTVQEIAAVITGLKERAAVLRSGVVLRGTESPYTEHDASEEIISRTLPKENVEASISGHPELYSSRGSSDGGGKTKSIILLAGSQDGDPSIERGGHGQFTEAILQVWNSRKEDPKLISGYDVFVSKVRSRIKAKGTVSVQVNGNNRDYVQTPNLFPEESEIDSSFLHQNFLEISAP